MKKKQTWTRIAAWIMTVAMLAGNSSFAALAQEMNEMTVQETAAEGMQKAGEAVPETTAVVGDDAVSGAEAEAGVEENAASGAEEEAGAEENAASGAEAEAGAEENAASGSEAEAGVEENAASGAEAEAGAEENAASGAEDGADAEENAVSGAEDGAGAEENAVSGAEGEADAGEEELIVGDSGEYAEDALLYETAALEADTADSTAGTEQPEYDYYLPLTGPNENEMLPGQEIEIGSTMFWTIKDGDNIWGEEFPIKNVEILAEYTWGENGEDIAAEEGSVVRLLGNAEEGWRLRGVNHGYANLRLTYINPDGEEESFGNLTDPEQDYRVYVCGDVFHVEWDYPNGTGNILVGESKEIGFSLKKEYYDGDGRHTYETVEDVQYGVIGYDETVADVSVNGPTLTVTGRQTGETRIFINAKIPNGEEEYQDASWTEIWVNVCDSYVNIEPVSLGNVEIGETLDLNSFGLKAVAYSPDSSRMSAVLENVRFRISDYDTNAWDVVTDEEGGPTALKRKAPWGTNVCVVAEQNQAAEGEAENWVEVGYRNYWFDECYYDVWLDSLRDDGWSWIYSNEEDFTLTLNTEALAGKEFTVDWTVGSFDEEGNCTQEVLDAYTVNAETNQITFHGSALAEQYPPLEGEDGPCIGVRATVCIDGIEVAGTQNDVRIREPYYNYYGVPAPDPGDRDLIPGEDIWINRQMACYADDAEHPYGEHLEVPIRNVEIISQGGWDDEDNETESGPEDPPVLVLEEEENGWRLRAQEFGWARVCITYETVTGGEATYGDNPEDPEDEFKVYVIGDVYRMEWMYPDDTEKMLYPGELTVSGSLRHEYRDNDGNTHSEPVEDFRLEILEYNNEFLEASVTEDGKSILITSKAPDRGEEIYATVYVHDENEPTGYGLVCDTILRVEITGGYYVVRFENPPADGQNLNPHAGEILNLNELQPAIYACNTENPEGVLVQDENLRISLTRTENDEKGWDEEAWDIVPDTENELIPSLKRKETWGTGINLFIEERMLDEEGNPQTDENGEQLWQEAARLYYDIPERNYDVWFDGLRGGDQTWVFRNENMELPLSISEELKEVPYEVEWATGSYDDENGFIPTTEPGGGYEVRENSIVLHGDSLDGYIIENTNGFYVRASVKVNGINVSEAQTWVWVADLRYDYDFPLSGAGENILLPGWSRGIWKEMNCYVEDEDHPHGEDVPVEITGVTVLGQGTDWNYEENAEQDYNIPEEEAILTLNQNEDGSWNLWANGNGFGYAHIRITYKDISSGENAAFDFPVFVSAEKYQLDWQYSDGTDFMLPNSTMDVSTNLIHFYLADDGSEQAETIEDYYLSVQWDDGSPAYDTNLLTVETYNKTGLNIISNENQWSTDIMVRVMCLNEDTPPAYTNEVFGDGIHVNVSESYFKIEPLELSADEQTVNPLLNESLNIADFNPELLYYCTEEEPRQWDEVRYMLGYDEDAWDTAEGSQTEQEPVDAAAIPKLVRKATWGTEVSLLALINVAEEGQEDWQVVAARSYYFDDITDRYQADFTYSYGGRMDEIPENPDEPIVSRVLTDIPLVLSLDTAGLNGIEKLEGFAVEWNFWQYNDETGMNEEVVCASWEAAKDGRSVSLTGFEEHVGQWIDIQAVVRYKNNDVITVWTHAMVDTCEHEWNREKEKLPTCTEKGYRTFRCTQCGGAKTDNLAALGHNYSKSFTTDVRATCTKKGSKSRHCTRCGAKTAVTVIPMTAHQGGTATCLAKAKCKVCGNSYGNKLKPVLKLTADSLKMRVKQSTAAFKVTAMGKGDYVTSVSSNNTKVLKVSSLDKKKGTFKLTALNKTGKANLTVKLASGLSKTITVTVQKGTVATTAIGGLASSLKLNKGKTVTLKPVIAPVTSQQKVTYKSSNKKIATVSSKGVIKAVKPGKAVITVKSGSKSKKVTVIVNPVKTTRITGVPAKADIKKGKKLTLKPKLVPSDSSEGIKYTTSNKKVATVTSKGVIKGVSKGTATITVTSGNKKVTCKVTVK